MTAIDSALSTWPRDDGGNYILGDTHEALLFAHLVHHKPQITRQITRSRERLYLDIQDEREKENPDMQRMMDLAVKAQFCRECLEEVVRINEGKFEL